MCSFLFDYCLFICLFFNLFCLIVVRFCKCFQSCPNSCFLLLFLSILFVYIVYILEIKRKKFGPLRLMDFLLSPSYPGLALVLRVKFPLETFVRPSRHLFLLVLKLLSVPLLSKTRQRQLDKSTWPGKLTGRVFQGVASRGR